MFALLFRAHGNAATILLSARPRRRCSRRCPTQNGQGAADGQCCMHSPADVGCAACAGAHWGQGAGRGSLILDLGVLSCFRWQCAAFSNKVPPRITLGLPYFDTMQGPSIFGPRLGLCLHRGKGKVVKHARPEFDHVITFCH